VTQNAVYQGAVSTGRVCAQKVRPGEYRPSVYQPSTYRSSVYRPAVYRPAVYRASVCIESDCIPAVNVPAVNVEAVDVKAVDVPARNLTAKTLPEVSSKCVSVLSDSKTTTYNVYADVLFAFNRASIRPKAERVLRQVARSLAKRSADRSIQVDGHTDTTGSPSYNQRLSMRRAAAVKQSLVAEGDIPADRIKTAGCGETRPIASNSEGSGRSRNRRVVVGVR